MSTTHYLKTWPAPFQAIFEGKKTCEWRRNDRDFQVGDTLILQEWVPEGDPVCAVEFPDEYTGRRITVEVTDIQKGPDWGIPEGYCMMSIQRLDSITVPVFFRVGSFGSHFAEVVLPSGRMFYQSDESSRAARHCLQQAFQKPADEYRRYREEHPS